MTLDYEQNLLSNSSFTRIVGIDEVGRGCLAGPVAVGAYVVDLNTRQLDGVDDSKRLNLKQRETLHAGLIQQSDYRVFYSEVAEINQLGLGKSLRQLIHRAISHFADQRTFFLVDGRFAEDFGPNSQQVIKGDAQYYSIAAAAIVAKVERDRLMNELDAQFPGYNFAQHKGYGTSEHRQAIKNLGTCIQHRTIYSYFDR